MMRRGALAGAAAMLLLLVGCGSSIAGSGTPTADSVTTTSASRTLGQPTNSTASRTTPSTTSSSRTTSSSSSSGSSSDEPWSANVVSHAYPSGLRDVSPGGAVYAAVSDNKLCLGDLPGGNLKCQIDVTDATDGVLAMFSADGKYLGAVLTRAGSSAIWMVDIASGEPRILGPDGWTTDVNAALVLNVANAAWDIDNKTFLVQELPAAGATTGDLLVAPTDGTKPFPLPVPADLANSSPQMTASDKGLVYVENTGQGAGQAWLLDYDNYNVTEIGTGSLNDGGTVILVAVAPDGSEALICPAQGAQIDELQRLDLATGEVTDYLQDDACDGAVYSPDSRYVAIAGPVGDSTDSVLSVFDNSTSDVMVSATLEGDAQTTPARMTWGADDTLAIVPADGTDPTATVSVVKVSRN